MLELKLKRGYFCRQKITWKNSRKFKCHF